MLLLIVVNGIKTALVDININPFLLSLVGSWVCVAVEPASNEDFIKILNRIENGKKRPDRSDLPFFFVLLTPFFFVPNQAIL